eukprot:Clim_evm69s207 gene=Clim_evmTU69s207
MSSFDPMEILKHLRAPGGLYVMTVSFILLHLLTFLVDWSTMYWFTWIGILGCFAFHGYEAYAFTQKENTYPAKGAVLVTGCSGGIGLTGAVALAAKGFVVYATVRKEADKAIITEKATQLRLQLKPLIMDVSNLESIQKGVAELKKDLENTGKNLIGLVNNAGIGPVRPNEIISDDEYTKIMDTNVTGVFRLTNLVLPMLREGAKKLDRRARLIVVSSVSALLTTGDSGVYSASKAAVDMLMVSYKMSFIETKQPIDVISIRPGPVKTNIQDKMVGNYPTLDGELKELYSQAKTKALKTQKTMKSLASPPEYIANQLEEAMLLKRPHLFAYLPQHLAFLLLGYLPTNAQVEIGTRM